MIVQIAFTIAFVCLIIWCIVLWQYITGRPYWGEHRHSSFLPCLTLVTIPVLNLVMIAVSVIGGSIMVIHEWLQHIRQKALNKKNINPL